MPWIDSRLKARVPEEGRPRAHGPGRRRGARRCGPGRSYRWRRGLVTQEGRPAMPDSDPSAHALDVPGARLYYERRGSGPLLLMIGSPMDSAGFAPLAGALADEYTVVT